MHDNVNMPGFLIDAQCGYHFRKIMIYNHVAKPVVIWGCVVTQKNKCVPFSSKNATIYKHFD